jgi:hypothetical protein
LGLNGSFFFDGARSVKDRRNAIPLYNNTLQNCFPGNVRTIPFIPSVNRVARTSEECKPDRATKSPIGLRFFGAQKLAF